MVEKILDGQATDVTVYARRNSTSPHQSWYGYKKTGTGTATLTVTNADSGNSIDTYSVPPTNPTDVEDVWFVAPSRIKIQQSNTVGAVAIDFWAEGFDLET